MSSCEAVRETTKVVRDISELDFPSVPSTPVQVVATESFQQRPVSSSVTIQALVLVPQVPEIAPPSSNVTDSSLAPTPYQAIKKLFSENVMPEIVSSSQTTIVPPQSKTEILDVIRTEKDFQKANQALINFFELKSYSEYLIRLLFEKIVEERRLNLLPVFFNYVNWKLDQLPKILSESLRDGHKDARCVTLRLIAMKKLEIHSLLKELILSCNWSNSRWRGEWRKFSPEQITLVFDLIMIGKVKKRDFLMQLSNEWNPKSLFEDDCHERKSFFSKLIAEVSAILPEIVCKNKPVSQPAMVTGSAPHKGNVSFPIEEAIPLIERINAIETYRSFAESIRTEKDLVRLDNLFANHTDLLSYSDPCTGSPIELIFQRGDLNLLLILSKYRVSNWNKLPVLLKEFLERKVVDVRPVLLRLIVLDRLDLKMLLEAIRGSEACAYLVQEIEQIMGKKSDVEALNNRAQVIEENVKAFDAFIESVRSAKTVTELDKLFSENRQLLLYDASLSCRVLSLIFPTFSSDIPSIHERYPELGLKRLPELCARHFLDRNHLPLLLQYVAAGALDVQSFPQATSGMVAYDDYSYPFPLNTRKICGDVKRLFGGSQTIDRIGVLKMVREIENFDACKKLISQKAPLAELERLLATGYYSPVSNSELFGCALDTIGVDQTEVLSLLCNYHSKNDFLESYIVKGLSGIDNHRKFLLRYMALKLIEGQKLDSKEMSIAVAKAFSGSGYNHLASEIRDLINVHFISMCGLLNNSKPGYDRWNITQRLAKAFGVSESVIKQRVAEESKAVAPPPLNKEKLKARIEVLEKFIKVRHLFLHSNLKEFTLSERSQVDELMKSLCDSTEYQEDGSLRLIGTFCDQHLWNKLLVMCDYNPPDITSLSDHLARKVSNCPMTIVDQLIDRGKLNPKVLLKNVINRSWHPVRYPENPDSHYEWCEKEAVPLEGVLQELILRSCMAGEDAFDVCGIENRGQLLDPRFIRHISKVLQLTYDETKAKLRRLESQTTKCVIQ